MEINTLVLETLQRAVSQDSCIFKPAVQKLQEWETQPGFYSLLKVWVLTSLYHVI